MGICSDLDDLCTTTVPPRTGLDAYLPCWTQKDAERSHPVGTIILGHANRSMRCYVMRMGRYVDRAVFDNAAVAAAIAVETDGGETILNTMLTTLTRSYQDDHLPDDVLRAGRSIRGMVREHGAANGLSDDLVARLLLDLSEMVRTEQPDGTKRSRWFAGRLFHRQRYQLPNKVRTAEQHFAQYLARHLRRSASDTKGSPERPAS